MKLNIFTDFHYCEFKDPAVQAIAQNYYFSFLKDLANDKADYIFCLGDLATEGNVSHYDKMKPIINVNHNFINVLGNHDTSFVSKNVIQKYFDSERYFIKEFDDIAIIGLDSTKSFSPNNWGGLIDQDQFDWLEEAIDRTLGKNLIVFAHHAIANTTLNSDKEMSNIENSDELMRILNKNKNNNLFICGHVHHNSKVKQNNWIYIQLGATIDTDSYLSVDIDKQTIKTHLNTVMSVHQADKSFLNHVLHFTAICDNQPIEDTVIKIGE